MNNIEKIQKKKKKKKPPSSPKEKLSKPGEIALKSFVLFSNNQ